ncbi:WD40-repeat containing protein [Gracilaria domingensis]|nr:WD40-repeat containing protein [Gracilaria domingensis]
MPSSWYEGSDGVGIDRIAAYQELTFAAVGNNIGVYHRLRPFGLWSAHQAPIISFTVVGNILISISEDGKVVVWNLPGTPKDEPAVGGSMVSDFHIPHDFEVTAICHPQTYINKILLGAKDGRCMLVNFRTKKVIHVFSGFSSSIAVLEPSPVVDVVAVGTVDGEIHLHNFRMDETIVTYRHDSDDTIVDDDGIAVISTNTVNTISFRTDTDESMMTSDASGNMFIWDLNQKRVRSEARLVHTGGGASLAHFLPGEPLLITAGKTDNSVKVHIFDDENGQARILRWREGHYLPPTMVRFCGYDGFMMVSAGLDRDLRLVSAVQQGRNRSFSQKETGNRGINSRKRRRKEKKVEAGDHRQNGGTKLPRITTFATGNVRERDDDFANIVTIHEGLQAAYTWRLQSGATHEHILRPPPGPKKYELTFKRGEKEPTKQKSSSSSRSAWESRQSTSVVLSPCGNFAYVGGENGRLHAYNLQSGRHQGVFEDPELAETVSDAPVETETATRAWGRAHSCRVAGVSVDACGDTLISAGGEDRRIKFWTMYTRKPNGDSISTRADISRVSWSTTSDLFAVACTDFVVYVYDAITRKLARCFSGHRGPLVDLCFDINGRRLISASMDSTLKTWDLPSGRLFDTLHCDDAPTSVAVAPNGEYIATTHVNNLGVKLWVDMSRFGPVKRRIRKRDHDQAQSNSLDAEDQDTEADVESDRESDFQNCGDHMFDVPTNDGNALPLSDDIITLSTMPTSTWTVLSNLQAIKQRNKPVEPPKKAESAPFFIPTKKSLHMEFDLDIGNKSNSEKDGENYSELGKIRKVDVQKDDDESWMNSALGKLLFGKKFDDATRFLNALDASGVDMEIRTMTGRKTLCNAALFFETRLRSAQEFELTQAHLGVFLRAHGAELAKYGEGGELLQKLLDEQRQAWERLRDMFDSVLALSAHFSGQL